MTLGILFVFLHVRVDKGEEQENSIEQGQVTNGQLRAYGPE